MEIPRLISVDDHVIEPAHVWQENLPIGYRDSGPVLVRRRGRSVFAGKTWVLEEDDTAPWADSWSYDGTLFPIDRNFAAVSFPREDRGSGAMIFDDMRAGCYDRKARLGRHGHQPHRGVTVLPHLSPLLRSDLPRGQRSRARGSMHPCLQRLDDR